MIPDEAVDAAAKAWVGRHAQPGSWTLEENLRVALEAAAPILMAAAWSEGAHFGGLYPVVFADDNPYSEGAGDNL